MYTAAYICHTCAVCTYLFRYVRCTCMRLKASLHTFRFTFLLCTLLQLSFVRREDRLWKRNEAYWGMIRIGQYVMTRPRPIDRGLHHHWQRWLIITGPYPLWVDDPNRMSVHNGSKKHNFNLVGSLVVSTSRSTLYFNPAISSDGLRLDRDSQEPLGMLPGWAGAHMVRFVGNHLFNALITSECLNNISQCLWL